VNLTELYLSENGIEKIENLEQNIKVETLDVAKNRIKVIENIDKLTEMEEFWVSFVFLVTLTILKLNSQSGQRQRNLQLEVHRRTESKYEA
jgi:Leucine-rich repeat (LRR) protein